MGGGEEALLVRYHTGHGTVAKNDQVTFEFAAAYRHYHAALMHVSLTGAVDPRQREMFTACVDALQSCARSLTRISFALMRTSRPLRWTSASTT